MASTFIDQRKSFNKLHVCNKYLEGVGVGVGCREGVRVPKHLIKPNKHRQVESLNNIITLCIWLESSSIPHGVR
jgi:hypothetical protein